MSPFEMNIISLKKIEQRTKFKNQGINHCKIVTPVRQKFHHPSHSSWSEILGLIMWA